MIERYQNVPATCVSDAMEGLNNMDAGIKPLDSRYAVVGRAVTVKMPVGDNMSVLKGIRLAQPGDVLVVDGKGFENRSAAGDFVIGLAQTLGLAGVVIDGTIRDCASILRSGYPVFCRGTTTGCCNKYGAGEVNVPISCGGAAVRPGDIIVGDVDGVVVVPQEKAEAVLAGALAKLKKDEDRAAGILGNPDAARRYIDELLAK